MKVLEVNFRDWGGGSPNVAVMLTEELNAHGVDATLGVWEMRSGLPFVVRLPEKKTLKTPFVVWLMKKACRKIAKPFKACSNSLFKPYKIKWISSKQAHRMTSK